MYPKKSGDRDEGGDEAFASDTLGEGERLGNAQRNPEQKTRRLRAQRSRGLDATGTENWNRNNSATEKRGVDLEVLL
ncbi:hypothetical protein PInf_008125 [Phytophthora infestans]|nr:hypothetical protein PInf_008125 [Phytophthora infestans]